MVTTQRFYSEQSCSTTASPRTLTGTVSNLSSTPSPTVRSGNQSAHMLTTPTRQPMSPSRNTGSSVGLTPPKTLYQFQSTSQGPAPMIRSSSLPGLPNNKDPRKPQYLGTEHSKPQLVGAEHSMPRAWSQTSITSAPAMTPVRGSFNSWRGSPFPKF